MLPEFDLQREAADVRHDLSHDAAGAFLAGALENAHHGHLTELASLLREPLPFARVHVPRFPTDERFVGFDVAFKPWRVLVLLQGAGGSGLRHEQNYKAVIMHFLAWHEPAVGRLVARERRVMRL